MKKSATLPVELLKAFEQVPDLYLILSPDLHILTASDAYLKATQTTRKAITGKNLFEAFPESPASKDAQAAANLQTSLLQVLKTGQPHRMAQQHYDIVTPDGTVTEKYWLPLNTPVLNQAG